MGNKSVTLDASKIAISPFFQGLDKWRPLTILLRFTASQPRARVSKTHFDQHVERNHDVAALKNILHRSRNTGVKGILAVTGNSRISRDGAQTAANSPSSAREAVLPPDGIFKTVGSRTDRLFQDYLAGRPSAWPGIQIWQYYSLKVKPCTILCHPPT